MIIFSRTTDDSASNRSTLLGQNGKIDLKLVLGLFASSNSLGFDTPFLSVSPHLLLPQLRTKKRKS